MPDRKPITVIKPSKNPVRPAEGNVLPNVEGSAFTVQTPEAVPVAAEEPIMSVPVGRSGPDQWEERAPAAAPGLPPVSPLPEQPLAQPEIIQANDLAPGNATIESTAMAPQQPTQPPSAPAGVAAPIEHAQAQIPTPPVEASPQPTAWLETPAPSTAPIDSPQPAAAATEQTFTPEPLEEIFSGDHKSGIHGPKAVSNATIASPGPLPTEAGSLVAPSTSQPESASQVATPQAAIPAQAPIAPQAPMPAPEQMTAPAPITAAEQVPPPVESAPVASPVENLPNGPELPNVQASEIPLPTETATQTLPEPQPVQHLEPSSEPQLAEPEERGKTETTANTTNQPTSLLGKLLEFVKFKPGRAGAKIQTGLTSLPGVRGGINSGDTNPWQQAHASRKDKRGQEAA